MKPVAYREPRKRGEKEFFVDTPDFGSSLICGSCFILYTPYSYPAVARHSPRFHTAKERGVSPATPSYISLAFRASLSLAFSLSILHSLFSSSLRESVARGFVGSFAIPATSRNVGISGADYFGKSLILDREINICREFYRMREFAQDNFHVFDTFSRARNAWRI